jgi:glucose-1-phosphate cytidylyltransferase
MKVVILAGGLGSRLAEETDLKPKPMVEVGGRPILWHIMQHYAFYGFHEFVLCLGYKGEVIKRYIMDYAKLTHDLTIKTGSGDILRHSRGEQTLNWTVDLIDTGVNSQTGGRLKRVKQHVGSSTFMMTYGDGVSNIDLRALLEFHKRQGKLATISCVRPPARFGHMHFEGDLITRFNEKPQTEAGWINGGYFVLEPQVFDYISGDSTAWEREPLENLARDRQLSAYKHEGFWQCMDTLRDRRLLEELWSADTAPWKMQMTPP